MAMTREELTRIALRYDTVMSRAMLRALGVDVPHRARPGTIVNVDRFNDIESCFSQKHGVVL